MDGLKQETTKLHEKLQTQEKSKVLLTEKSKEALELSNKNAELQAEVEKLKGELTKKDEELIQKDEKQVREREALTDNVANSFMAGFKDVVVQTLGIYPEMDFSQLGLEKTVVDGRLVDEEE